MKCLSTPAETCGRTTMTTRCSRAEHPGSWKVATRDTSAPMAHDTGALIIGHGRMCLRRTGTRRTQASCRPAIAPVQAHLRGFYSLNTTPWARTIAECSSAPTRDAIQSLHIIPFGRVRDSFSALVPTLLRHLLPTIRNMCGTIVQTMLTPTSGFARATWPLEQMVHSL